MQSRHGVGHAVLLLHGWPRDIHTYGDVALRLAAAGHRVIVPHRAVAAPHAPLGVDALQRSRRLLPPMPSR